MSAGQLSLYIDLEEGKKADLEAVARAILAYASAIREIAAFLDPFSDTQIDLVDTTEGSISLNTKIKFRTATGTFETTIYALIVVFVCYLAAHVGDAITEKAISAVWETVAGPQESTMSESDKKDIVDRAVKALEAKAGENQIKQIYMELDQDPSVSGLGVSTSPGGRPTYIVPRSEFARRSGTYKLPTPEITSRSRREILTAILVSPVLQNDRRRRWRFRVGDNEFGAPIKDHVFLDAVFSGKHPLIMKGNIRMRVAIAWSEEFIDGVWVGKDYVVWSVIDVPGQYQGPQELLPFDDQPKAQRKPKTGKKER